MTVAGARSARGDVDRDERGRDEQRRARARPAGDPARLGGGEEEAALVSAGDQARGAGGVALAGAGEHGGRAGGRGGGGRGRAHRCFIGVRPSLVVSRGTVLVNYAPRWSSTARTRRWS